MTAKKHSSKQQFFQSLKTAAASRQQNTRQHNIRQHSADAQAHSTITPEEWRVGRPAYQPTRAAPAWSDEQCRTRLIAQLESQNSKIIELETIEELPAAIFDAVQGLPGGNRIYSGDNPLINNLTWSDQQPHHQQAYHQKAHYQKADHQKDHHEKSGPPALINAADLTIKEIESPALVCLSTAFAAAAESGTLFLASGRDNPTHLNFLSSCHIILLDRAAICQTYEQALEIGRSHWSKNGQNNPPRTINLISGPSRTADIEQTLTLGAHGPIDLIVVIYN